MVRISVLLAFLLIVLTFNAYACVLPLQQTAKMDCASGTEEPVRETCDAFLEMGPLPNADKNYFHGSIAYWNEMMEHPNYDEWWKARDTRPHLKNIKPAVMTVGGWFDAEDLFGSIETYRAFETPDELEKENQAPPSAPTQASLLQARICQ